MWILLVNDHHMTKFIKVNFAKLEYHKFWNLARRLVCLFSNKEIRLVLYFFIPSPLCVCVCLSLSALY